MEISEVREGEAVELRKVDRVELGIIETSFATSRIGHWKRDSWVRVNGIELLPIIRLPRVGFTPTLAAIIVLGNLNCTYELRDHIWLYRTQKQVSVLA